jgi:hypothetical protein
LETWLGLTVVVGALTWWFFTGTPSLQVDADAVVVGAIGVLLAAISLVRGRNTTVTFAALVLAALATGLGLAHVWPLTPGAWEVDRVLAGSLMILGSLGYMAAVVKRLSAQLHWMTLTVVFVAVAFLVYLVLVYSRNVAIA